MRVLIGIGVDAGSRHDSPKYLIRFRDDDSASVPADCNGRYGTHTDSRAGADVRHRGRRALLNLPADAGDLRHIQD